MFINSKRILIILAIPTIIVAAFMVVYSVVFSAKNLENNIIASDTSQQCKVCDVDGNGVDEILLFEFRDTTQQYIKIADMDLHPIDHLPLLNAEQNKAFLDDIDDDGIEELLLFRVRNDSMQLNIYVFEDKSLRLERTLHFPAGVNSNGKWIKDQSLGYRGSADVNRDGKNDLLFQLHANQGYQPRSLFAYDLSGDSVIWEYKYGTAMSCFNINDFNGDGQMEILMGSRAFGNGGGKYVNDTNDSYSYITLLSIKGDVLWQEKVGGFFSWCSTYGCKWEHDSIPNVYAVITPCNPQEFSRKDDSTFLSARLMAFNGKSGICLARKNLGDNPSAFQMTYSHSHSLGKDIRLVTTPNDGGIRLYTTFLKEIAVSKFYIDPKIKGFHDIDRDGIDEIFLISNNQELIILNRYLQELFRFQTPNYGKLRTAELVRNEILNEGRLVFGTEEVFVSDFPAPPPIILAGIYKSLKNYYIVPGLATVVILLVIANVWQRLSWSSFAVEASELNIHPGRGLLALDLHDRVTFANKRAQDMLNFPHKWRLKKLSELLPEEQCINLLAFISQIKDNDQLQNTLELPLRINGQLQTYEIKYEKPKSKRFKEVSILSLHDPRPKSMSDLFMDWYGWATDVAHQMKNTIAGAMHSIELARHSLSNSNPRHSQIDSDLNEGSKLLARSSELTKRIMQFNIRAPRFESFQIRELLQKSIDSTILKARSSCECRIIDSVADFEIMTDERLFIELMSYLLQNSMEAIDHQNGRIRISAELASELHAEKAVEKYNIKIVDNGCGISEEDKNKIYKIHFTTKAEKSGTGLGIPRAIQICEVLGGELSIESEKGKGTKAMIIFKRINGDVNHG